MSAPKPKYTPRPRGWTDEQVAARLNVSMTYFQAHKAKLYEAGMPRPNPLLANRTDSKALELWLDDLSNIGLANNDDSESHIKQIRARAG